MTLKDLAKEAGVSVATVSKAFNHSAEISQATKEKIFAIAKKHGCYNKYRKEKHERKLVAVVCPEIKSSYYSERVEYIQERLKRKNIDVLISTDDFNNEKQKQLIALHAHHTKADGMILFGLRNNIPKGIEMPIVSINKENHIQHADTIQLNFKKPLFAAVKHLKELGHTHIAFIGEELTKLKQAYFEAALKQYGLPCSADRLILTDSRFEEAGRQGAARLLQTKTPFTAVICAYDNIAIGAIKTFTEQGIQVPEDVSVIGCNNIPAAGHLERSLTTIDEAPQAVCDIACDLLIKKMKNKYYCSGTNIEISGSLILRETTAPANKKKPPC